MHTYKNGLDQIINDGVHVKWLRSTWIINTIKIIIKQGSDTINDVIPTKYHKYPSNTILKYANVLAKLNKSP